MSRETLPPTRVCLEPYRGPADRDAGILKLDGNEGARPPAELLEALSGQDLDVLRDYPDVRELEADIAGLLGVQPEQVVVTAGADGALDRICRAYLEAGRRMVLPVPAFEMIYRFVAVAGGDITPVPWIDDYPTDQVIAALGPDVSLVAMISPNNPTGRVATAADLTRVAEASAGALVLLDHAYVDYANEDLTSLAAAMDNVVVVRSFSKAWGLAGCRIGYAVAPPEVATVLRNAGNPYPVAGLSIAAVRVQIATGVAALHGHVSRVRQERTLLAGKLLELGASPHPSEANFVFADFGHRADLVYEGLAGLGVKVRRFPHRQEITDGLRITVPETDADRDRLFAALEAVLAPEAVLFDMDGVLADVEQSYRRCVLETAAAFGASITRADLEAAVLEGDANSDWVLTQRILARRGIDVSLEEVTARYQEFYLGTEGRPGFREGERALVSADLLERLSARMPLAVVTGRPREEAEWFLEREGFTGFFDEVICAEDAPLKPDPAPVRLALERLGVAGAWMVGDTPDDVRAAASAGVIPLGLVASTSDTQRTTEALREAGAALILDDISQIEEFLP